MCNNVYANASMGKLYGRKYMNKLKIDTKYIH